MLIALKTLKVMKAMNYRMAALMAAVLMAVTATAKTPDVTGTVLDEKGEPMPFVNVVLLSLPDSTFVQGAMTDDQGHFHISTPKNDGLLKVSSVGYETQFLNPVDGQIIKMVPDLRTIDSELHTGINILACGITQVEGHRGIILQQHLLLNVDAQSCLTVTQRQ